MTRTLFVDEAAQDEAEAQAAYYVEHAGTAVALAFVAELDHESTQTSLSMRKAAVGTHDVDTVSRLSAIKTRSPPCGGQRFSRKALSS